MSARRGAPDATRSLTFASSSHRLHGAPAAGRVCAATGTGTYTVQGSYGNTNGYTYSVATLRPGTSHIYSKRVFYIDEDSWAILATDKYDGRGELWRTAELHNENWYNVPMFFGTMEVHNDLQSGRYIAMGLRSEEKMIYEPLKRSSADYTPNNLRGMGTR